jgi:hypothetical protein
MTMVVAHYVITLKRDFWSELSGFARVDMQIGVQDIRSAL